MKNHKDSETLKSYSSDEPEVECSSTEHSSTAGIDEDFVDRLNQCASIAGSVNALAKQAGVSQSGIRRYFSGGEPTRPVLSAIANACGVNFLWLATGEGPMRPGDTDRPPALSDFYEDVDRSDVRLGHSEEARRARMGIKEVHPPAAADDYYHLPLYDVRASAGHGAFNHTEPVVCMLAFRKDWIRTEIGVPPEQLCLIYSTGESMETTIYSRDVLLIDKSVNEIAVEGIYVLMLDGTLMIKRCQRLPGRKIKVISDNQAYEPFILDDDNLHSPEQHIVGQVVWAGRKFR